jgi:hypothetical protein
VFEKMQDRLREQWRSRMGRPARPTAAVIDAQSNRISPQGGASGFDAAKKVKGRKRNLVVDTTDLVIALTVTAASVQDRDAAAAGERDDGNLARPYANGRASRRDQRGVRSPAEALGRRTYPCVD